MKTIRILLIFFITYFSFNNYVFGSIFICDNSEELCESTTEIKTLTGFTSFEGNYSNIDAGYLGNINNILLDGNTDRYNKQGFFDEHKVTKILNNTPKYQFNLGYLGNINNILLDGNTNGYNKQGFFDEHKITKILNNIPKYQFDLGYIATFKEQLEEESSKLKLNGKIIQNGLSYKEYYKEVFKILTDSKFKELGYNNQDYEKFINNITDFVFMNVYIGYKKVDVNYHNEVKNYLKETDFEKNINKLMLSLEDINQVFFMATTREEKDYTLQYYLN